MSLGPQYDGELAGTPAKSRRQAGNGTARVNSRRILQLLRLHQPCSSSDLARFSGLSVPTVVSGMARMEQIGLVKRVGKGWSSGGRPPDMLAFNEAYGYVA